MIQSDYNLLQTLLKIPINNTYLASISIMIQRNLNFMFEITQQNDCSRLIVAQLFNCCFLFHLHFLQTFEFKCQSANTNH